MSPIVVTNSSPAGRIRRVRAAVLSTGGVYPFDGPGPNAPSWAGATSLVTQTYAADIPHYSTGVDASGFEMFEGSEIPSGYFARTYEPVRVQYPTVDTPFGTRRVMRMRFPGQTNTISGNGQLSTPWVYRNKSGSGISVQIRGTWSGTIEFEESTDDGATWVALTMTGRTAGVPFSSATTATTSVNGYWLLSQGPNDSTRRLFRARASEWMSGTATIESGMQGGQSPVTMRQGVFGSGKKKVYSRHVYRASPNWINNEISGTKAFFFAQSQGQNHYTNFSDRVIGNKVSVGFGLQGTLSGDFFPGPGSVGSGIPAANITSIGVPFGEWIDIEYIYIASTPGVADGIMKIWMNGELALDLSNVPYFTSLQTAEFTGQYWNATYGGGATCPPDILHIDHAMWHAIVAP